MRDLITDPADLTPQTTWRETSWAWTSEEQLIDHQTKSRLCAAVLLPFCDGVPDWDSLFASIRWLQAAADHYAVPFVPVLNADTGYIFDMDDQQYAEVLQRFRGEFPDMRFIAGITARGAQQDSGFVAERYRPLLDLAQIYDNCEVMLMTSYGLNQLDPERRRDAYFEIAQWVQRPAIVHALEPSFIPWATPFEPWLLWQLAQHPKFVGGKISTLDEPHFLYWSSMCRDLQLDFQPHSGDDFGIATAVKIGRPSLIGAASSAAPLICAAKDMWLDDNAPNKRFVTGTGRFDTRVYKLFEALQSLEDQVFRLNNHGSAASYKHSTAHVLHELGVIATAQPHPASKDLRGDDEAQRMREALLRPRKVAAAMDIPGF